MAPNHTPQDASGQFSTRLSPPINERGDRILVPGQPEALEKLVRHKNIVLRAEARERVRTMLEKQCPKVLDVIDQETLDGLLDLVVSACHETARARDLQLADIVKATGVHLPTYTCIPDIRDGPLDLQRSLAEFSGRPDPTVIDSPAS